VKSLILRGGIAHAEDQASSPKSALKTSLKSTVQTASTAGETGKWLGGMPWLKAWACSLQEKDMAIRLRRIAMPPDHVVSEKSFIGQKKNWLPEAK
jgi:hypothetical protein